MAVCCCLCLMMSWSSQSLSKAFVRSWCWDTLPRTQVFAFPARSALRRSRLRWHYSTSRQRAMFRFHCWMPPSPRPRKGFANLLDSSIDLERTFQRLRA
jgi:hypothetical protein